MSDASTRIVLVTAPDPGAAEELVGRLVEEGAVACGTIVPDVTSIYRWQGAVERGREALIILKTTAVGADRLLSRVPELHPYGVPEVLVLPVEAGHGPYLAWVAQNVGGASD